VRNGGCGNPEVVGSDRRSAPLQLTPDVGVHASDRLGDGHRVEGDQDVLDEGAPAGAVLVRGADDSVEQLADADDADRPFLVAREPLEDGASGPFPVDQQIGVDQDGQAGASGGPTERRSSRTSSANASSTGGAEASSSRNRSAERTRSFGGAITAIGAPARVTSISSPDETRFSTSENRRATSVAVIFAIEAAYPINQMYMRKTA
jgi:hypothetical protein